MFSIKIVADKKIPHIDSAFGKFGVLVTVESGAINSAMVRDADALIIRSETRVDEKLLTGSKVSFVGTATIGTDHVDTQFLAKHGIKFASAPGCNAFAVVQYIFAALFVIAKRKGHELRGKTLGVVGVGNVGSKVVRVAKAIGMKVLENDPPIARLTGDSRFFTLDQLLNQADIITLHVPLTTQGMDPTFHLFDEGRISKMKQGAVLINSSRGAVVKTDALKNALSQGRLSAAVLDVWEHEPNVNPELLSLCEIGTPHIAGYSIDGKVNATRMIYQAFCEQFKSPQTPLLAEQAWNSSDIIPQPKEPVIKIVEGISDEEVLSKVVKHCYDIEKDDESLRRIVSVQADERGKFFKRLRGNYNLRHEFSNFTVVLPKGQASLRETLKSFGFKVQNNH